MPTSTFFNLPLPKREKLLQAAVAEFSRQPYGEVSLSPVIKAAGIPRGSFYQYFADKTDLFRYVLSCYGQRLEDWVLDSLDACGGKLMDLPLTLFDRLVVYLREDEEDLRAFMGVLRQNVGVDITQMWDIAPLIRTLLERADWDSLRVYGRGEQAALLELLLSSTAQALGMACCGKAGPEEKRRHLEHKIALLRRGLEMNGENEKSAFA